jgi:hypothetical protein
MVRDETAAAGPGVDLWWIPLGSGAHVVRLSGKAFEATAALLGRRPRCDLYHSALLVAGAGTRHVIEVAPIPAGGGAGRGVVAEGAVGSTLLSSLRIFRYEVRCWRDGTIPDAAFAVDSPVRVLDGVEGAMSVVDLVHRVPTPVWGRHELARGDMWNSNSVTSWLLARAGVDVDAVSLPHGGRAPGWDAGISVARGLSR